MQYSIDVPQNTMNRLTICSRYWTLEGNEASRDICDISVHIVFITN